MCYCHGEHLYQKELEEEWLISAYNWSLSLREIQARAAAEAMEESYLLSSTPLTGSFLVPQEPRDGPTHRELGPPLSVINQENAHRLPTGQADGGISSTEVSSSQMKPARVKLTKEAERLIKGFPGESDGRNC